MLQDLVDFTIARGLKGLETLTGIPGSVGAAVYGNAGAYGHSISERVSSVRFFDGGRCASSTTRSASSTIAKAFSSGTKSGSSSRPNCCWSPPMPRMLRETADDILKVRNEKFPVTMKCAGSIFKNLLLTELPADVAAQVPPAIVREGKVPAAWFLEQVGAKGMQRGDIHVAAYHANLIYNAGAGTAADLVGLIQDLKARVRARFGIELEEEVQYVGRFSRFGGMAHDRCA